MRPHSRYRRWRSCGSCEPERPEQDCSELRLPAASAGRLQEAVTVVSAGLWAEVLSLERGRVRGSCFPQFHTATGKGSSSPLQRSWDGSADDGSTFPPVSIRRPRADLRGGSLATASGHHPSQPGGRERVAFPSPRSLPSRGRRGARPQPLPGAGGQLLGSGADGAAVVSAV